MLSTTRSKFAFGLWVVILVASGAWVLERLERGDAFDSDFLALLPQEDVDAAEQRALARLSDAVASRIVALVGHTSEDAAADTAAALEARLAESGLFQATDLADARSRDFTALYSHRFQLIEQASLDALTTRPSSVIDEAISAFSSPFETYRLAQIETDPLGLFGRYVAGLIPRDVDVGFDARALVERNGVHWAIVTATFEPESFDLRALSALQRLMADFEGQVAPGVEILATGLPLFVADGAHRAQREISTVGLGSIVIICLALILTFRSPLPLFDAVLSVAFGLLCALAVSFLVFDRIHLITLVFGSTLVGVSVDYALHYLCDPFRDSKRTPAETIRHILPGIGLGLISTLVAYASIGAAPFPALRQLALFSAVGLTAAWLTVVVALPKLGKRLPKSPPALLRTASRYRAKFPKISDRSLAGLWLVAISLLAITLFNAPIDDDVRQLQTPSAGLIRQSEQVQEIVSKGRDSQFVLISGSNGDALLVNEGAVTRVLDELIAQGRLKDYSAVSAAYPSPQRQRDNYGVLKAALYDTGEIDRLFRAIGARDGVADAHHRAFSGAANVSLGVDAWLEVVGEPWRDLWLGCDSTGCHSIVTLRGYAGLTDADISRIRSLPESRVIDRASELSAIMAKYRIIAASLLVIACIAVTLILSFTLGLKSGIRIASVPFAAVLVTTVAMTVVGIPMTLFTVFAIMLVIGLGFDYGIFHRLHGADPATALAIALSALTTLSAFGLLALSDTEVVRQFGTTLAVGISSAYLFGPLASNPTTQAADG